MTKKQWVLAVSALPASVALLYSGVILANHFDDDAVYAQSGDVSAKSAVVWGRCNREADARLVVRLSASPEFGSDHELDHDGDQGQKRTELGPVVTDKTDYTGSVVLEGLQSDKTYYYQVLCLNKPGFDPNDADMGPVGKFRTAPSRREARPVRFVWAADLAGQGWGRNPELAITDVYGNTIQGGYVIFDVMRRLEPDFAVFAGDIIYADNPIPATKEIPPEVGGGTWVNSPTKDFVAITLDQYRENWRYNLGDDKLQRFLLDTPMYIQWDDHEVTNNWYPGEILTAEPYNGLPADELAGRARQALFEYNPIDSKELYRTFQHGEHLEIFLLDERSFRGPNPENSDPNGIEMLGKKQFQWLKQSLKQSRATWKVISTHDPLSLVTGGPTDRDAWAQGDPQVLGREVQLSQLLKFIKDEGIKNVVYITADVHFAAAISYEPERAVFGDFEPFWEFVIGPVHAGAFGANAPDDSFGPVFEFVRAPSTEGLPANSPPPNLQSFGAVEVSETGRLTVRIHDVTGAVLYEKAMDPK